MLAVANGTFRELVLHPVLGETAARQLSTLVLLALLTGYMRELEVRWPLPSTATALRVGGTWVAMTIGFEFGLGHFVEHKSWSTLLADYDITAGRIWILVPLWTLVAPAVIRGVRRRPGHAAGD